MTTQGNFSEGPTQSSFAQHQAVSFSKDEIPALLNAKNFAKLLFNSVIIGNIGAVLIIVSVYLSLASQVSIISISGSDINAGIEGGLVAAYVGILMQLIALIYLRRSLKILSGISPIFARPYLGANLALSALALLLILLLAKPNMLIYITTLQPVPNLGDLILLIIIGIIALVDLVGFVMAVIIGSLRLRDRYGIEEFKTATILLILSYIIVFILVFPALRKYSTAVDKALAIVQSSTII
ncbi:hypothetical protein [Vulcanisaeta sp. JCM 16159]|uniref:hypothetical protein n=1 Tax=Vulcanisaeta sp. JCM 16159 TaxID=1295371 RepID=UPI0006D23793|nr:hypothetical protein [Vulcanisaeta sp. JCM 16159]